MSRAGDSGSDALAYPSKRDWWIVLIIWATLAMTIVAGVRVAQSASTSVPGLIFVLFCGAAILMLLSVLYATYYMISGDQLTAHCGPFKYSVPLASITEVVPSRNPLSSPALSLDRLHIKYRGSTFGLLISPRDKQAFLTDLVAHAPHLQIDGDRAVSAGP